MKHLKRFNEDIKIPIFDERSKDLAPKSLEIITSNGHYTLELCDFYVAGNSHLLNIVYHHNPSEESGDVTSDGEPDYLCFDIRFTRDDNGMRTLCDITYGDNMVCEFTITPDNKITLGHYNGIGSISDPDTHFAFTDESLSEIVKFFNRFSHGINLTVKDFDFLDNRKDSYKYPNKGKSIPITGSIKLNPLPLGEKMIFIDNAKSKDEVYSKNVCTYLDLRGIEYVKVGDFNDLKRLGDQNIVGVISGGSTFNLDDSDCDEKVKLNSSILKLFKVPFLGICFGTQALCKLYGGSVEKNDKEVFDKVKLDEFDEDCPLFSGCSLDKLQVSFDHNYKISECPKDFKVIAKSGEGISGIQKDNKFGLMFHPEDIASTHDILDNFIGLCNKTRNHKDLVMSGKFESIKRFKNFK